MSKKQRRNVIPLSLIFTLISMGMFITKMLNSFYGKAQEEGASAITKYAVIPLLVVLAVCFVVTVILNIRDAKAVKASAADTKFAMKTTKNVSAIMEAVTQLIDVIIAIVIAYDAYAGVETKGLWGNFRLYFTLIILIYTLMTTVYFIVKKSMKIKKGADKRTAAKAKDAEKQQRIEERQRQIEEASAAKAQKEAERKAAEKAAMPVKDQSHKPVKKITKK